MPDSPQHSEQQWSRGFCWSELRRSNVGTIRRFGCSPRKPLNAKMVKQEKMEQQLDLPSMATLHSLIDFLQQSSCFLSSLLDSHTAPCPQGPHWKSREACCPFQWKSTSLQARRGNLLQCQESPEGVCILSDRPHHPFYLFSFSEHELVRLIW